MSTIAIFGATGFTGGHILSEALSRGHRVIAIARDASALAGRDGVEVRSGSVHDGTFVAEAAKDAEVLAVAIPHRSIDGGAPLVDALPSLLSAARSGSARLGLVGGAGSTLQSAGGPRVMDAPDFPDAFKPEARAADDVLTAIRASDGVDWFVLSPAQGYGSYAPGESTGSYRTGDEVTITDEAGNSFISGADFATAFVDELEHPAHHRARFTVGY